MFLTSIRIRQHSFKVAHILVAIITMSNFNQNGNYVGTFYPSGQATPLYQGHQSAHSIRRHGTHFDLQRNEFRRPLQVRNINNCGTTSNREYWCGKKMKVYNKTPQRRRRSDIFSDDDDDDDLEI
mmetsp:Transcript_19748/g.30008  ORF Transcript_19748/g.30008 Transcript_19748/m.30008 type:complete len:125 (-) Transcript_19748:1548-1922(-)